MQGAPAIDPSVEPEGFVVTVGAGERIHFLDWGGPRGGAPGIVLVHGIGATAWAWTPVARRLRQERHVVAMDLRGHGLSDAPTEGYDEASLADDAVAVAEGSGIAAPGERRVLLAGHGLGGIIAAWAAARLGTRCAGLVLVDGGWEDVGAESGMEVDEFLRTIEEPPEVYRSMRAYLADRRAFDPSTWDADQERAARAAVVEVPAGRVVPVTRPHVVAGMVSAMLSYRPHEVLPAVVPPIVALVAGPDDRRAGDWGFARVERFTDAGHNLMRYRPEAVAAAIRGTGGTIADVAATEER